jgi:hypothetical protein
MQTLQYSFWGSPVLENITSKKAGSITKVYPPLSGIAKGIAPRTAGVNLGLDVEQRLARWAESHQRTQVQFLPRSGPLRQPLCHSGLNNRPIRQQYDKKHILDWSFNRVRKANKPKWDRLCPKLLRFERADLGVIKGRHKIGSDLSRLLFGNSIGRILFTSLKDEFQRAAVLGGTSVSESSTDMSGRISERTIRNVTR